MALQSTTALATVTLQAASSTVTFSGIPNTYRDLVLTINAKTSRTAFDQDGLFIRLNGDTSNHSRVTMLGRSSETLSDSTSSLGVPLAGNAGQPGAILVQIMDYAQTDKHKTVLARSNQNSPSVSGVVSATAGRWASTTPITSIVLLPEVGPDFAAGSTFSLFGRIA